MNNKNNALKISYKTNVSSHTPLHSHQKYNHLKLIQNCKSTISQLQKNTTTKRSIKLQAFVQ